MGYSIWKYQINGVDIRDIPLSQLMNSISMVFQRVYLFQDTIYNNIAMGRPEATKEEVIEAAKKARCYDFIMALPNGFEPSLVKVGLLYLVVKSKESRLRDAF